MRHLRMFWLGAVLLLGCAGSPPAADLADAGQATVEPPTPMSDAGRALPPPGPPFEGCPRAGDAQPVFDAFWTAFDRDYALFDLRLPGERWDDVGRETCATLESPGEDALFDALLAMGRRLDDGHVTLVAASLNRDEDAWVSAYPHDDALSEVELTVESGYLDDDLTWGADDSFAWGRDGDVGYLSITSMDDLSESGDEADDVAAAAAAMQRVARDLADARAIIVDVRANGGGWDSVALEVAAWFAGPRALAWTERRRSGPGHTDFSEPEPTFVDETRAGGLEARVALLTSGGTFSAAETFALAMRVRDRVTVVGEPTSGHFSDLFDHELPNGWEMTLSAERYEAADGQLYETRGVPVDLDAPFDPGALGRGQDTMYEAARAALAP